MTSSTWWHRLCLTDTVSQCDGFDHTATCEVGTISALSLQLQQAHRGSQLTAPRSQAGPTALAVRTVARAATEKEAVGPELVGLDEEAFGQRSEARSKVTSPETLVGDWRGQSYFNIKTLTCLPSSSRELGGVLEAAWCVRHDRRRCSGDQLAPMKPGSERKLTERKWCRSS